MLLAVSIIVAICGTHFARGQGPPPGYRAPTWKPTNRPTLKPVVPFDNGPFATKSLSRTARGACNGPGYCGADCNAACAWSKTAPLTCHHNRATRPGYSKDCTCYNCVRKCGANEFASAHYNVDECDIDPIANRQRDMDEEWRDFAIKTAISAVGFVGKRGPYVSFVMDVANDLFRMALDDPNEQINGVIADVNERNAKLLNCMDQKFTKLSKGLVINKIEEVYISYSEAAEYIVESKEDMDEKRDRVYAAWVQFRELSDAWFNDKKHDAQYYKNLTVPLQNIVQLFTLTAVDYLTIAYYYKNSQNFQNAFENTIDSFNVLVEWVNRAHDYIVNKELRVRMYQNPCSNWEAMEAHIAEWENKFLEANLYPIEHDIDLIRAHYAVLTDHGSWFKGAKGATCDDTCQNLGLTCDSEQQSTITSSNKVKNAFAEAGYTSIQSVTIEIMQVLHSALGAAVMIVFIFRRVPKVYAMPMQIQGILPYVIADKLSDGTKAQRVQRVTTRAKAKDWRVMPISKVPLPRNLRSKMHFPRQDMNANGFMTMIYWALHSPTVPDQITPHVII